MDRLAAINIIAAREGIGIFVVGRVIKASYVNLLQLAGGRVTSLQIRCLEFCNGSESLANDRLRTVGLE